MAKVALLLRAVNVGGRKVPMAELRGLLDELGFPGAQTYLASGNAVLEISGEDIATQVEHALLTRFGFAVPVIARSHEQLALTLTHTPPSGADPSSYFVHFLSGTAPPPDLDPDGYVPDRWWWHGDEVHVWCPEGVRESKLSNVFWEKRTGLVGTARNWNTVRALHRMTA